MNKYGGKNRILPAVIFIAVAVIICVLLYLIMAVEKLYFTESAATLGNPGQGMYVQVDSRKPEKISELRGEGVRLALLACNLNGYQSKELDDAKLNEIEYAFKIAEQEGVQVIFRAAYGFEEGEETVEPESMDTVLFHIGQIAEVLNGYSKHLVCVQAGMIGPWGEWHSSSLLENKEENEKIELRNSVVRRWMEALKGETIVQLRRPLFVRQAVDDGLPIERLGFHNDALFSTDSDMGTYREEEGGGRAAELQWVKDNLWHGLTGGEMPQISEYTKADNAVEEMRLLGLTYLNSRYNEEVLEDWNEQTYEQQNALNYIKRCMGNRLYIEEAGLPENILWFEAANYSFVLANSGFAPRQNGLNVKLVVKQDDELAYYPIEKENIEARADGGMLISGKLPKIKATGGEAVFEIGLWLGYGEPQDAELTYRLANSEGMYYFKQSVFFAKYQKKGLLWKLLPGAW